MSAKKCVIIIESCIDCKWHQVMYTRQTNGWYRMPIMDGEDADNLFCLPQQRRIGKAGCDIPSWCGLDNAGKRALQGYKSMRALDMPERFKDEKNKRRKMK